MIDFEQLTDNECRVLLKRLSRHMRETAGVTFVTIPSEPKPPKEPR